jgi:transcriptional regulator with XRE-family HTH domain
LPSALQRAFAKLGQDLSAARRRRRLTMALAAERALISRATLSRVERGDPSVSMGIYATVLHIYGLGDRVGELADLGSDEIGRALELERLPKRVRRTSRIPDGGGP